MNPPLDLRKQGQSVWLDNIHNSQESHPGRSLQRSIENDGVSGITTGPALAHPRESHDSGQSRNLGGWKSLDRLSRHTSYQAVRRRTNQGEELRRIHPEPHEQDRKNNNCITAEHRQRERGGLHFPSSLREI